MKRILTFFIGLVAALAATAQVDNYALRFSGPEGVVNLGSVSAFKQADDYTLQFWMNVDTWADGAALVRCGDFVVRLDAENGSIVIADGVNTFPVTDTRLRAGKWAQLTLRSSAEQGTRLLINNKKEYTTTAAIALPADSKSIWLGGGFLGRIDEVRLWNGQLPADYNSYWQNTLNDLIPSWKTLAAYWKMDQEQCANLVDYKGDANGTLSASGVAKEQVTDNKSFRYLANLAYGNVERFFDRQVDKRHYSLSNRIALIGAEVNPTTLSLDMRLDRYDAKLNDATLVEDSKRHKGVIEFDGSQSVSLPGGILSKAPENYAFEAWLKIDEWVPGAVIFTKGKAFTIKLGEEEGALDVNGQTVNKITMPVGSWFHMGVCTSAGGYSVLVKNTVRTLEATTTLAASNVAPKIGTNFKGRMDEIMIWKGERTTAQMISDASEPPLADYQISVSGPTYRTMDACYLFDDPNDPGFDSFSVQRIFRTIRSYNEGMRGVKYIFTVSFNPFKNEAIDTPEKRTTLAKALAAVGNDPDYDGIDFDFEWPVGNEWQNVGLLYEEVRGLLDADKEMSATPHAFYYGYPTNKMKYVDRFYFQIYGPGQTSLFTMPTYEESAKAFVNYGYTKNKIVMSYATTTSGGRDSADGGSRVPSGTPGFYPAGYRGIWSESVKPSANVIYSSANNCYYFLTGFDQVIDRCQYVLDNSLGGIMYWDLGNDLPATNKASLARGASYVINSNVEALVTEVATAAPAPEDDPNAPTYTPADITEITAPADADTPTYDLQGRRVITPRHGLYIRNHKLLPL